MIFEEIVKMAATSLNIESLHYTPRFGDGHWLTRRCGQVSELDLPKAKATDLLRTHDGVLDAAIKGFVVPGVKA